MANNPPTDNQDKQAWCDEGDKREELFVATVAPRLGLRAIVNPEKKVDKKKPDLFVDEHMADLKSEWTPFFRAGKYGCDPSQTVTLNLPQIIRYRNQYPLLHIYFWVWWEEQTQYGVKVAAREGIWMCSVPKILDLIKRREIPVHVYKDREEATEGPYAGTGRDKDGNACSSYLIEFKHLRCLAQFHKDDTEDAA